MERGKAMIGAKVNETYQTNWNRLEGANGVTNYKILRKTEVKKNFLLFLTAASFFSFAVWLPHSQLWATFEGEVIPKVTGSLVMRLGPKARWSAHWVSTGKLPIRNVTLSNYLVALFSLRYCNKNLFQGFPSAKVRRCRRQHFPSKFINRIIV